MAAASATTMGPCWHQGLLKHPTGQCSSMKPDMKQHGRMIEPATFKWITIRTAWMEALNQSRLQHPEAAALALEQMLRSLMNTTLSTRAKLAVAEPGESQRVVDSQKGVDLGVDQFSAAYWDYQALLFDHQLHIYGGCLACLQYGRPCYLVEEELPSHNKYDEDTPFSVNEDRLKWLDLDTYALNAPQTAGARSQVISIPTSGQPRISSTRNQPSLSIHGHQARQLSSPISLRGGGRPSDNKPSRPSLISKDRIDYANEVCAKLSAAVTEGDGRTGRSSHQQEPSYHPISTPGPLPVPSHPYHFRVSTPRHEAKDTETTSDPTHLIATKLE